MKLKKQEAAQACPGCGRLLFPTRAHTWPAHYQNPTARFMDRLWCRWSDEPVTVTYA